MCILASDFLKKTINMQLNLEIHVVCREISAFKHVLSFFETNQMIIFICIENLKTRFFTTPYPLLFVCAGRDY